MKKERYCLNKRLTCQPCPSDKHYIKFACPIPKSSRPKSFARFVSQMELIKSNEMVAEWQS